MKNANSSNNEFSESWKISCGYIKQGISIIPVRDKADSKNPAKSPYYKWKKYQEIIITESELFQQLERLNTAATAFICGPISGNLEIIDVDEKNWPGIGVMLFEQIEKFMPSIWKSLRIHKTPSGGRHIIYKISEHEPAGNLKLAWKEGVVEAAIESRGTGGYALTDASLNYSAEFDRPIPTITWIERCSLFAICEGFNEKKKVEAIKPQKSQSFYYCENPFEDYNKRDGGTILSENGWSVFGEKSGNAKFIHYTRPGKKQGISASFNKERNCYYIFTSSTELINSTAYLPSMVLSKLRFKGDNKECYKWLVENGYGKVDKVKELRFAESYAKKKLPLPGNFSDVAKAKYQETTEKIAEAYPYGEFIKWDNDAEKMDVSREAFYNVAGQLGFRILDDQILLIEEQLVHKCTERQFYDHMKAYIKNDVQEELEKLLNIYEKFIQKNGAFSQTRLPEFDKGLLIKDDRENAYLFFQNGWTQITSKDIVLKNWCDLNQLVYAEKVRKRDYVYSEDGGIYQDFIEKAVGYDEYCESIIGFICHEFKDERTGFLPVFVERCENPKDGGGAGKNVLCNTFSFTTTYINKNCTGVKFDEKFFQVWTGQKVLGLSDLPEHFNFGDLKEAVTGSLVHKRLFKDEVEVGVMDTPKIICQTNYAVEIKDGGVARRVRLLEFSDFFTKKGGVDIYYGKHFPIDWSIEDWIGYDNVIARAIQNWIRLGCIIIKREMTESGWKKEFKQTYGSTITEIINAYIEEWKNKKKITTVCFNNNLEKYYLDYKTPQKYNVSPQKMNNALVDYCKYYNIAFNKDGQWRESGDKVKGKIFGNVEDIDAIE